MKILGELKSKRGHDKLDYLISLTPHEFFTLKQLVARASSPPERHNGIEKERNTFRGLQQFFRELKVRENGELITDWNPTP